MPGVVAIAYFSIIYWSPSKKAENGMVLRMPSGMTSRVSTLFSRNKGSTSAKTSS